MSTDYSNETWRAIPSLPDYIASSHGRLMRLPWGGRMPYGGMKPHGGRPTHGVWSPTDNRYILQYRGKTYKVARLICEAFHGAPPEGKPVCMHLDENSRNNRSGNLAWGSQKENMNAPGYIAAITADRRYGPPKKLSAEQRAEIVRRVRSGEVKAALAKEFGVAACTVSNLTRGRAA